MNNTVLDDFILELLHINDVGNNRLLDLGNKNTFLLSHPLHPGRDLLTWAVNIAKVKYGQTGNTILLDSALNVGNEQTVGYNYEFNWVNPDGVRDVKELDTFIEKAYKEIGLKGNNPLVMGIGALRWMVEKARDTVSTITSPILVYPIKLNRSSPTTPITITYVADDVYLNPCLIAKLEQIWGEEMVKAFPHPNGEGVSYDTPVDLVQLGDGREYFQKVSTFIKECGEKDASGRTVFEFEDKVAITQYAHDEICAYYDIKRNYDIIVEHPIIRTIFEEGYKVPVPNNTKGAVKFVLPSDSVQQRIIRRVVNGESLVIKGPPGTGKTLTIANMVAALIAANKRVLLVSQKRTALTEIYRKLPISLRKFAMLMEAETEDAASKISPNSIKNELSQLLKESNERAKDGRIQEAYERENVRKSTIIDDLSEYKKLVFGSEFIAGVSYYEALDRVLKYPSIRDVDFAPSEMAMGINRDQYAQMEEAIVSASKDYDYLTENGNISIRKNPWMPENREPISDNALDILVNYKEIVKDIGVLREEVSKVVDLEYAGEMGIKSFVALYEEILSLDEIEKILRAQKRGIEEKLTNLLAEYYLKVDEKLLQDYYFKESDDALVEIANELFKADVDRSLSVADFGLVAEKAELLSKMNDANVNEVYGLVLDYVTAREEKKRLLEESFKVFSRNLDEEQLKIIDKAYDKLAQYENSGKDKPSALDMGAKGVIKKLQPLSYLSDVSFKELVKGVCDFHRASEQGLGEQKSTSALARVFQKELTEKEVLAISILVKGALKEKQGVQKYLAKIVNAKAPVVSAKFNLEHRLGKDYTIFEMQQAYSAKKTLITLIKKVKEVLFGYEIEKEVSKDSVKDILTQLIAVHELDGATRKDELATKLNVVGNVREKGARAVGVAREVLNKFAHVGKNYIVNYYTRNASLVTFNDLAYFLKQATDNEAISAVNDYLKVVNGNFALPVGDFLKEIEEDLSLRGSNEIVDVFENAVFKLAIRAFMSLLDKDKLFNLGKNATEKLEQFSEVSEKCNELQAKIIEQDALARIKTYDRGEFAFLNAERELIQSLRYLFKKNASGILKLKRCFLMAPSSASVLFKEKEFCDFDVLIMDESSQVTPTSAISVLFRCKQCVLVGDEHQMPPIKRFKAKSDSIKVQEGEEVFEYQKDISILSLALKNEAFYFEGATEAPVEKLQCHYRSESETLIEFSQKRYYPDMRTFPSTEPKITEGKLRGLFDVYTPNGITVKGVNEVEANKVVECIKEHFDRHYNGITKELKASLGIVTFGKEQLLYVQNLIKKDKELYDKIHEAISHFEDAPEKLIFFKTIDTVQGQEADNLIVSLTYGRKEKGISNSFGELNNSSLGECIFNVAVTRARSSVTFIHSIRSMDIENPRVDFIRDYLANVERFGSVEGENRDQFVGEKDMPLGFIRSVGNFLVECGVPEDRVVYDYGVTQGSIRIPIAILSSDYSRADIGIWCEKDVKNMQYYDYNARYYEILKDRGWSLYRLQAHDWYFNHEQEQIKIKKLLRDKNII